LGTGFGAKVLGEGKGVEAFFLQIVFEGDALWEFFVFEDNEIEPIGLCR
jgi:hypothetical protein